MKLFQYYLEFKIKIHVFYLILRQIFSFLTNDHYLDNIYLKNLNIQFYLHLNRYG